MSLGRIVCRGAESYGDSTGLTSTIAASPGLSALARDTLVVVWSFAQSQLAAATVPAGWAELGRSSQSTTVGSIIGWKRAAEGESGNSYSFTVGSNFRQSLVIGVYGNLDPATLTAVAHVETSSGTSHATPSGAAAKDGVVVLTAISERNNIPNLSWTAPSGYTRREDAEYGGSNATTSTSLADNLTPLSTGASYGGASWTGGRTSETSVVTWTITGLPAPAEAVGLNMAPVV